MPGVPDKIYLRPLPAPAPAAGRVRGGWVAFSEGVIRRRGAPPERLPVEAISALYPAALERVAGPAPCIAGVGLDRPRIMGIVNATPDSFSDGGALKNCADAVAHAQRLVEEGADFLDIGGESTRPGADPVGTQEEMDRVLPVIEGLVAAGCSVPISIDTRKAPVARAATGAGARIINDVSALGDPEMPAAARGADALVLMHAQGDPRTMQDDPRYDDVVLDIHDWLEERIGAAMESGIAPERLVVDPGIGFGKTVTHNLRLIAELATFHDLGAPILLGASRKGFIGRIAGVGNASERMPGSIAVALAGVAQGAQILRVHDVAATVQAIALSQAVNAHGHWKDDQ